MSSLIKPHLDVKNLNQIVKTSDKELQILHDINFTINDGESVSIVGVSGSGKSTLLGLLAGLESPSNGTIELAGNNITQMDEDQRALVRAQHVGFIFQSFQLLPNLTAAENVLLPLEITNQKGARQKAETLLARVGLKDRIEHYPRQLSGGEQQRVAIARAFVSEPDILFADEPTGNLDEATGAHIEDLLFEMNNEKNTTLVLVTHDPKLANRCGRKLQMKGGRLSEIAIEAGNE